WRFGRPLESTRARLVATVVYVSIPLAANSLARGRWPGLVAYAVAPWLVGGLARATGLEPWATPGELPRRVPTLLRLGLPLAGPGVGRLRGRGAVARARSGLRRPAAVQRRARRRGAARMGLRRGRRPAAAHRPGVALGVGGALVGRRPGVCGRGVGGQQGMGA